MRVDCLLSRIDFNVFTKNKFYQRNVAIPSRFEGCIGVGCWCFVVVGTASFHLDESLACIRET